MHQQPRSRLRPQGSCGSSVRRRRGVRIAAVKASAGTRLAVWAEERIGVRDATGFDVLKRAGVPAPSADLRQRTDA
jgi:hypothetical protein